MGHNQDFLTFKNLLGKRTSQSFRNELTASLGISQATYYRRLRKVKDRPVASSLIPESRGTKKGAYRTSDTIENLMSEIIQTKYLTKQKPRISKCYLYLIERFVSAGLEVPSESTFRRRIAALHRSKKLSERMYASERRSKHSPKTQHFTSLAPMALVQIDHTKLNAILVSSIDGEVLGRAIFTVISDIYTRLVLGIHVGLHGPDHESVSHALAHACFDKTDYLEKIGIVGDWPNLGLPDILHMDNAKEFKSGALIHGCGEYGIERQYRPVATPHFGGHIESLIKTLNENLRNIPGATFADWKERGGYPSESMACFTLPLIEKHITNYIVNFYHKKRHSKLGVSPIQKYQHAIRQGFKARMSPKAKGMFIADMSESHMRNVRNLGVEFECKEYWSPYLASLYNQNIDQIRVLPVSETVKFINVLGLDGELHKVPAKDTGLPDVTRREWRRYRKIILERNKSHKMTNSEIAHYIRQENEIELAAKRQSLRLRKAHESQFLKRTQGNQKVEFTFTNNNNLTPVMFDPKSAFHTSRKDDDCG